MAINSEFSVGDRVRFVGEENIYYAKRYGIPLEGELDNLNVCKQGHMRGHPHSYSGWFNLYRVEHVSDGPW